jgi:hypothetical protein
MFMSYMRQQNWICQKVGKPITVDSISKFSATYAWINAADDLEKSRQAAKARVIACLRQRLREEGGSSLQKPQAQVIAPKQEYNKRQRQRAVAYAINQLLQMAESGRRAETDNMCNEAIHTSRAV